MEFEQKAEEKKMSMSKNIARLAVTAGLTAALSFGGVMAPVTMAFAAEGGSAVTFKDGGYSSTTTYKGIQIFTADVNGTNVKNIKWAGANDAQKKAIQDAVVKAINDWSVANSKGTYTSTIAQDAADWLSNNHGVTGNIEQVANNNVLSMIAANLNGSGFDWKMTSAGTPSLTGLGAGYWLFLTNAVDSTATDNSTDAFSAPMYAVIDGKTSMNVTPKKDVPTVDKEILDDAAAAAAATDIKTSGQWEKIADSQIGQEVNYKLTGSVASNYATYDSYAYKFTDNLSSGLDYVNDSVKVYAFDGSSYTEIQANKYDARCVDNKLTVEFKVGEGKKGLKDVEGVNASTKIVVFYKAKLNSNAVIGNAKDESGSFKKGGNLNTVTLEYSNNPYGVDKGETIGDTVADFAFKLNLKKVDQGTEKGLGDAVFTIQSADTNTNNQYIASTEGTVDGVSVVAGQLVTVTDTKNLPECVKFTSGNDGKIVVSGLDAGSYKVTEIQTPDPAKYPTTADPFTFTITSTYDKGTMNVKTLEAKVSKADEKRTDIAFGELDGNTGDNALHGQDDTGTDAAAGEVTINVGNTKSVGLPLTGLNGVTFTWIAGGAVLCIGVAHLIRSRKQAEESEQE